jgi:hypothetical protein
MAKKVFFHPRDHGLWNPTFPILERSPGRIRPTLVEVRVENNGIKDNPIYSTILHLYKKAKTPQAVLIGLNSYTELLVFLISQGLQFR